jgi:hypothetical protein
VTARAKTLDRRTAGDAAIILRCLGESWEKGNGRGFVSKDRSETSKSGLGDKSKFKKQILRQLPPILKLEENRHYS